MEDQLKEMILPDGTYPLYQWMGEPMRRWIIAHNFRHWMQNDIPLKLKEK